MYFYDGGCGVLEENEIFNHKYSGIQIRCLIIDKTLNSHYLSASFYFYVLKRRYVLIILALFFSGLVVTLV